MDLLTIILIGIGVGCFPVALAAEMKGDGGHPLYLLILFLLIGFFWLRSRDEEDE